MTTTTEVLDQTEAKPGDLVEHKGRPMVWLGGEAYAHPDLARMLGPIEELSSHPENPRVGDQQAIDQSVRVNGLYRPAYVQRDGMVILAGNHTTKAVRNLGGVLMPRVLLDVDADEARRILLTDNGSADLGRYDEAKLLQVMSEVAATELGLLGSSYDDEAMALLAETVNAAELDAGGDDDSDHRAPTTSEMLAIADVTWGDPRHKVHHGQVWQLGHHTLVVAKLAHEHHLWRDRLEDEVMFCPYPEPYLTTTEQAATHRMLLVQPNPYLAGHLLDKHESTHPDDTVRLVSGPGLEVEA